MKTIVPQLVAFLLLVPTAEAQINGFTSSTARWHVAETSSANIQAFLETWTTSYGTAGDTMMAGALWQRIVSSPDATLSTNVTNLGWVRQDGEVVLYQAPDSVPDTLYDFGMQVGDSSRYMFAGLPAYLHLLSVDTVWISGFPHRRFHFGSHGLGFCYLGVEQWIEGIGSTRGPLFPLVAREFCEEFHETLSLTCFEEDGTLHWSNPDFPDCIVNVLLGVAGPDRYMDTPQVRPNPGGDRVWLSPITKSLRARVFDVRGMEVMDERVMDPQGGLDMTGLGPGVYTIRLYTAQGRIHTVKWMKQ